MTPHTFIDPAHQKSFNENGYIVLDVLPLSTVQALNSLYQNNLVQIDGERSNFNAVSDPEKNNNITKESHRLLAPHFDKIFTDYTNNGATFFIKEKSQGELPIHQDTILTDFENHFSCYAWIPLHDVTVQNGCMTVISKSHLFFNNFLSFTYFNDPLAMRPKREYLTTVEMKAGQILFFHNRLFHGSYANQTDTSRVAINSLITSKGMPLAYYQKKDEHTASEYFVTPESYLNSFPTYSKGLLPDGAVFSKDIPYKHVPINTELLNEACANIYKKPSLLNRLRKVFAN